MKPIEPMQPLPQSAFARLKNNSILQAWLVLVLCLLFSSALAGIQMSLGPVIEENKINETREKVPELLMGKEAAEKMTGAGQSLAVTPLSIPVEKNGRQILYNVFEAKDPESKPMGWVVKCGGQGYADRIELLLGIDANLEKISGLFILEQKETPGLGNKIITDEWRGQFTGKSIGKTLAVVKTGAKTPEDINAITGATISSKSVTQIVNTAVADIKGPLSQNAVKGN